MSVAAEPSRSAKTESSAAHCDTAIHVASVPINAKMIHMQQREMSSIKKRLFSVGFLDAPATTSAVARDGLNALSVLTTSASAVSLESVSSQVQTKATASSKEDKKISAVKHPPLTKDKLTGKSRGETSFIIDSAATDDLVPNITGKAMIPRVSRSIANLVRQPKDATSSALADAAEAPPPTKASNKLATLPKQPPLQSIATKQHETVTTQPRLESNPDMVRVAKIESSAMSVSSDAASVSSQPIAPSARTVTILKHDGPDKTSTNRIDRGVVMLESAIAAVNIIEREQVQRARDISSRSECNPSIHANDSILYHRMLEAQAMNRKGDEQGATMHKFSLWSNVKKPVQVMDPASSEDTIDTAIAPDKKAGRLRGPHAVRAELEAIDAKDEESNMTVSKESIQAPENGIRIEQSSIENAAEITGPPVETGPNFARRPSLNGSGGLASALRNLVGSAKIPTEESVSLSPYDAEEFSYLNTRGSIDSLEEESGLLSPFEEDGDLLSRATSLAESSRIQAAHSISTERDDDYTTSDFERDSKIDGEATATTSSMTQSDSHNMSASSIENIDCATKATDLSGTDEGKTSNVNHFDLGATVVLTSNLNTCPLPDSQLDSNPHFKAHTSVSDDSPAQENNFALVEKTGLASAQDDSETPGKPGRLEHGKQIPWVKGESIGQGTFGRVYRGLNESTGELLAVKQIYLVDGSEREVESLRGEIRLMKSLSHKNIVRYLGTSVSDRYLFIIMEYVPGGSISSMLNQFGAFSESLVR
jgi:hypothetical protein